MYLYWRIQQELNEMGSKIIFHNPSLIRAYKKWRQKNSGGLAIAEKQSNSFGQWVKPSLN